MKLKDVLKGKLTKKELALLPTAFDIVGDIIIFADFPDELKKKEKLIGETLLSIFPNVKTVLKKIKKYSGKFRLPVLRVVAGRRKKETIHKENGVLLKLHVQNVYFSARTSTERKRISELVKPGERVLVMFSGCAPFPCNISKNSKAKEIVGVEFNPVAHKYALENIKMNKLDNVVLKKGDVRNVVPKLGKFDRVLMPLPKGGEDFLNVAISAVMKNGIIHFYDFLNERDFDLAKEKIDSACKEKKKKYKILNFVKCGQFGPGTYRICVDFKVN